jgi:RES domain-containing protein
MAQSAWRIAVDTPDYTADDLTGKGAEKTGGRWNRAGTPMLYCASTIALSCLETLVHLGGPVKLPLNRYLVKFTIPVAAWRNRTVFEPGDNVGWDAEPPGLVSLDWGTQWATATTSLIAEVPSVIVPEESCILVNPRHPGAKRLQVRKLRRWQYDARLGGGSTTR